MSTVSIQNESLPSFEPIEQKGTTQKRKRNSPSVKEDNNGLPAVKKSKAKKNPRSTNPPVTITKSIIWIGATLSQDDSASGAFSVYYGIGDTRNCTEKITLKENQNLDDIYTIGVIRALEICQDDTSSLCIYTGSKNLQQTFAQNIPHDNEICNELRQKIEKRKSSTSIHYNTNLPNVQEEYNIAHSLSNEKLLEDKMLIDEEETTIDSLQVKETKTEVSVLTTTADTIVTETKKIEVVTTVEETIIKEETTVEEDSSTIVEPLPTPSWASTLSLRNLLEVLKAPFARNNNKQK